MRHNIYFMEYADNLYYIVIGTNKVKEMMSLLAKSSFFKLNQLVDIFAVDYPDQQHRFQINYLLFSIVYPEDKYLFRILQEDTKAGVISLKEVFAAADWVEREMWDMFGIYIEGSFSLRRILTDYGFVGHPLCRDFPLSGFVAVRWSFLNSKIVVEPLNLTQEYRFFEFENPWLMK